MSKLLGLLAMGLAVAGCAQDSSTDEVTTSDQPILGGQNTTKGQFPDVVAVEANLGGSCGYLCTGTLVAPDLVLTAAHCVSTQQVALPPSEDGCGITLTQSELTAGLSIHVDATGVWGTGDPGITYGAANSASDPLFTQPGNPDLGLIWLGTPITDRDPSPVNFDATKAPIGLSATLVGFGVDNTGSAGRENVVFNKQSTSCAP